MIGFVSKKNLKKDDHQKDHDDLWELVHFTMESLKENLELTKEAMSLVSKAHNRIEMLEEIIRDQQIQIQILKEKENAFNPISQRKMM